MTLDGPFWIELFKSLPPTLAALATVIIALRTNRKIDVVHQQTNSTLTRLNEQLSSSKGENAALIDRIAVLDKRIEALESLKK